MTTKEIQDVKSCINSEMKKQLQAINIDESIFINTFIRYSSMYLCSNNIENNLIKFSMLYFKKHLSKATKQKIKKELTKFNVDTFNYDKRNIEVSKKAKIKRNKIKIETSKVKKDSHYYKNLSYVIALNLPFEVAYLLKEFIYQRKKNYYITYHSFRNFNEVNEVIREIKKIKSDKLHFKVYCIKLNNYKMKVAKISNNSNIVTDKQKRYYDFCNFNKLKLQNIISNHCNLLSNENNYFLLEYKIRNIIRSILLQEEMKQQREIIENTEITEKIIDILKDKLINNQLKSLSNNYLETIIRNEFVRLIIKEQKFIRYNQSGLTDLIDSEIYHSLQENINETTETKKLKYTINDFKIDLKLFQDVLKQFNITNNLKVIQRITYLRLNKSLLSEIILILENEYKLKFDKTLTTYFYDFIRKLDTTMKAFINDSVIDADAINSLLNSNLFSSENKNKRKYIKQIVYKF